MCEIPHLCHTHTAQNSKGHCPVSAFSPGLVTLMALKSSLEAQPKKFFMVQRQAGVTRISLAQEHLKHMAAKGTQREGGQLSKISHLQLFPHFCCLAVLCTSDLQVRFCPCPHSKSTAQSHHVDSFGHGCFPHEPNCLRKIPEEGSSGGNTGTENKGMALRTHWASSILHTKKELFPQNSSLLTFLSLFNALIFQKPEAETVEVFVSFVPLVSVHLVTHWNEQPCLHMTNIPIVLFQSNSEF